jgi:hypothetical protein
VADAKLIAGDSPQQILLTRRGTEALIHVEHILDDASKALAVQSGPVGTLGSLDGPAERANAIAAAGDQPAPKTSRRD